VVRDDLKIFIGYNEENLIYEFDGPYVLGDGKESRLQRMFTPRHLPLVCLLIYSLTCYLQIYRH
jgi:hypothetical protein